MIFHNLQENLFLLLISRNRRVEVLNQSNATLCQVIDNSHGFADCLARVVVVICSLSRIVLQKCVRQVQDAEQAKG